ncbi:Uncharacterised protein [Mycobacteroides abscessus]|nr:Uncharacterised protein [Mycobacteroides abscessus]
MRRRCASSSLFCRSSSSSRSVSSASIEEIARSMRSGPAT